MERFTVLVVAAALLVPGCTAYSSQRLVADEAAARRPEVFGDIEQQEFGKRVQVKLPSELAVAEVSASVARSRVNRADRRSVELTAAMAEEKSVFSNVQPLLAESDGLNYANLRSLAARHQADLMLVTTMSETVREDNGALVVLNLLVLPCLLVPTQTNEVTLHVRAAVVDVRNNLIYATFEDHRDQRVHSTSAGESDDVEDAFDRLYADSLTKLRQRVTDRLRQLETAAP